MKALAVFALAILLFNIAVMRINDRVARSVCDTILDIPLPPGTACLDTIAKAGKLVGSGNGMQYFGAVILKSTLSVDALAAYYEPHQIDGWHLTVARRPRQALDEISDALAPDGLADAPDMYLVYA